MPLKFHFGGRGGETHARSGQESTQGTTSRARLLPGESHMWERPSCTPDVHLVSKGNKWHQHHCWTPSTTCASEHSTRHLRCWIIPAAGESLQTRRQQSTVVPFSTQDQATGQKVLLEPYGISTQHPPLIQDLLIWLQSALQTHHSPSSLLPTRVDGSRKTLQDDPQGAGRWRHRWHHH